MSDPTVGLDELVDRAEAAARAGELDEAVAAWRAVLAHADADDSRLDYEILDEIHQLWRRAGRYENIGPTWQTESNPDLTSEVEVRFTAEPDDRTRVELEHRNLDRHGPGREGVRQGVEEGWPIYLDRYATLVA